MKAFCCVTAIALLAASAFAEAVRPDPAIPPDPASVVVPDLTFTPTKRDPNHYWEYFAFHKAGATYQKAFADLVECAGYSHYLVASGPVPKVVMFGDGRKIARDDAAPMFAGVVPSIIFAMASNSVNHSVERANTRRCMAYKDYKRYGLNSAIWDKISDGSEVVIIARLALIASAPTPPAVEIDP
jgi:hypothetical protein